MGNSTFMKQIKKKIRTEALRDFIEEKTTGRNGKGRTKFII